MKYGPAGAFSGQPRTAQQVTQEFRGRRKRQVSAPDDDVQQIVKLSVAQTDADWKAAPQYTFKERDVITKGGRTTSRTYQVLMINGSPYNKPIAIDNEPLSPARQAAEEQKLKLEIEEALSAASLVDGRAAEASEIRQFRARDQVTTYLRAHS